MATSVTTIGNGAFQQCNLTSLVIPTSVIFVGEVLICWLMLLCSYCLVLQYVFSQNMYLLTLSLPTSLIEISSYAFNDCTRLTSVVIPTYDICLLKGFWYFLVYRNEFCLTWFRSVTSIGNSSFFSAQASSLSSVELPTSLQHIAQNAFTSSGLMNLTIPTGVTLVDQVQHLRWWIVDFTGSPYFQSAFYFNKFLAYLSLPTSLTRITSSSFAYCYSLTSVVIPT